MAYLFLLECFYINFGGASAVPSPPAYAIEKIMENICTNLLKPGQELPYICRHTGFKMKTPTQPMVLSGTMLKT